MTASWPTYLATTLFVAHPGHLGRAQRRYVERLNQIPAGQARVHFSSASPTPEDDEFLLWSLRCTALYDGLRCEIPDPESLGLYSAYCVISYDPDFEDEVHERLFFADHPDPDPFPGLLRSVEVEQFVPGRAWNGDVPRWRPAPPSAPTPAPTASRWLVTLHLMAAEQEADVLETEYFRLLTTVPGIEGLGLVSSSPTPGRTDDDAVAGPLWLADTRQVVADVSLPSEYPLARRLHRARLVLDCDGDPTGLLPEPRLPGSWTVEPLS